MSTSVLTTNGRISPALYGSMAVFVVSLAIGCGPPESPPPDTGTADVGVDGGADGTDTGGDEFTCEHPEETDDTQRVEYELDRWLVADASSSNSVAEKLRAGNFEMPDAGAEKYGVQWEEKPVDPVDGEIATDGGRSFYAATTVEAAERTAFFARADAISRVWANGVPQPGDVYAHGDKRVAVPLEEGKNALVVQFRLPARGTPQLELYQTNSDVYFNTADMTTPELRVGTSTKQPVGVPVVNQFGATIHDVRAKVVENEHFEATTVEYPALGADAVTQVGFELEPKGEWEEAGETIPVTLQLSGCGFEKKWQTSIELETVAPDATFKRTFWSPVDRSVQYYAVVPPEDFATGKEYGLTLALHGASVEAKGHATSYSQKDWTYIIAPTNRRRFGFDWEEWGKLNGLAAMDHAKEQFTIDPSRQYVTGHSMGGHGTWHFAVMHPGRFAAVGPSAGWASFYTYSGTPKPEGVIDRARAHSDTFEWMPNLRDRAAYIVHGSEDQNVPPEEGKNLRDEMRKYSDNVKWHLEEGADHWWNGDRAEGTDCVDWPPLFETFENTKRDPTDLDFEFDTPGPWYSDHYSYVTIRSSETPDEDVKLESSSESDTKVTLETTNVRSMDIDGTALAEAGIETLVVDGDSMEVPDEQMTIGPEGGKGPGVHGTLNHAFRSPFCFVYPDDGPPEYRRYASYLLSVWSLRGNGHACALPRSRVTDSVRSNRNLIYLGLTPDRSDGEQLPFSLTGSELELGDWTFEDAAGWIAFPDGDWTSAAILATEGAETQLYGFHPFSSRSGMPDYFVQNDDGAAALGFFDSEWEFDESLGGRN